MTPTPPSGTAPALSDELCDAPAPTARCIKASARLQRMWRSRIQAQARRLDRRQRRVEAAATGGVLTPLSPGECKALHFPLNISGLWRGRS